EQRLRDRNPECPSSLEIDCELGSYRNARGKHLHEIIYDEAAFEKFEARRRNVPRRLAIKARAVSPLNPRLPDVRDDPAQGASRADVFQEPYAATGLYHAPKLAKRRYLQRVRENAKKKGRNGGIE